MASVLSTFHLKDGLYASLSFPRPPLYIRPCLCCRRSTGRIRVYPGVDPFLRGRLQYEPLYYIYTDRKSHHPDYPQLQLHQPDQHPPTSALKYNHVWRFSSIYTCPVSSTTAYLERLSKLARGTDRILSHPSQIDCEQNRVQGGCF
jgi:hypothetical protein